MTTDQATKPSTTSSLWEWITISLAEYAFYQHLEKQFKDIREMQIEVDEAMKYGKSYTNADDFIEELEKSQS